jgi:hypothetical protein
MAFSYMNTMNFDHNLPLAFSFPSPISHWFFPPKSSLNLASVNERKHAVFVFLRLAYFTKHYVP